MSSTCRRLLWVCGVCGGVGVRLGKNGVKVGLFLTTMEWPPCTKGITIATKWDILPLHTHSLGRHAMGWGQALDHHRGCGLLSRLTPHGCIPHSEQIEPHCPFPRFSMLGSQNVKATSASR